MTKQNEIRFQSRVVRETAYGIVEDLGVKPNRMTLTPAKSEFSIIWEVGEGDDMEEVEIGIWAQGDRVTDYDGVFEIPKEAIALLKANGFDTTELEVSDDE